MPIRHLDIRNFRSFNRQVIELGNLEVVIGANASGKTNFVQVVRFLRDIEDHGLRNAISMQGGADYVTNAKLGTARPLAVKVGLDLRYRFLLPISGEDENVVVGVKADQVTYEFSIQFRGTSEAFVIKTDRAVIDCRYVLLQRTKSGKVREESDLGAGTVSINKGGSQVNYNLLRGPQNVTVDRTRLRSPFLDEEQFPRDSLMLENIWLYLPGLPIPEENLVSASIFSFDPRLPKRAVPITGKWDLEEDGSNLPIVLRTVLDDPERKRRFVRLLGDLLPFVKDIRVARVADRSLLVTLKEAYAPTVDMPASSISDGTIHLICLIIALYFTDSKSILIEEPERSLHPFLISRLVSMCRDASETRQVILTTHNPETVKHVGLENLLLMTRDRGGFSRISRPQHSEQLRTFLQDQIGLDDLYVQNLLR